MSDRDKCPAFPAYPSPYGIQPAFTGMDLRDYFAASALIGLCTNPDNEQTFPDRARDAYYHADCMIKQRAK
jgi:hypothetical protein